MVMYNKMLSKFSISFFLLFLFSINKMVDSMDTCESLNINIKTVRKTKPMYNYVVKKIIFCNKKCS